MGEIPTRKDYSEQGNEKKRREREGEAYNLSLCSSKIVVPPSTRSATLSFLSLSKFTYTCLTRGGRPAILEKYQRLIITYGLFMAVICVLILRDLAGVSELLLFAQTFSE